MMSNRWAAVSALIQPGDTVLECACGTGLLSAAIAPKCKALTATDFAPKMLKKAEKNGVKFILLRNIGDAFISTNVSEEDMADSLKYYLSIQK